MNVATNKPFKGDNFDLIDFQKAKKVVSLKTADTRTSSWLRDLEGHIRSLNSRRPLVDGEPADVILDIRVQPGGKAAAEPLIRYGQERGIIVTVREFP